MASSRKPRPKDVDRLTQALVAAVAALRLARPRPRVAVAVSGGADSVALLDALATLAAQGRADALAGVLTVHHGLSEQADAWLECARDHASRLGLPHESEHVRLDPGDPRGLEAAARDARYAALARLCEACGADVVATAHHLDDVAETVLLQALRGAGLAGVAAMPMLRPLMPPPAIVQADSPVLLWRPLLEVPRSLLRARVDRLRLAHHEDPSNADTRFARNALRADVLPAIERHFPAYRGTLARLARHAAQAEALLAEAAAIDLERVAERHPALGDALRLSRWLALPAPRRGRVLRAWLARAGLRSPSVARLAEMQRQLERAVPDAAVMLTHQQRHVRRWRDWIVLDAPAAQPSPSATEPVTAIRWAGQSRIELPQFAGAILVEPEERADAPGIAQARLASGPLVLRPRRGRERIALAPGAVSRTLKNVFQERGVPSWQRPRLPIAFLGERLLWVAGIGFDARAADLQGPRLRLRWEAADTGGPRDPESGASA